MRVWSWVRELKHNPCPKVHKVKLWLRSAFTELNPSKMTHDSQVGEAKREVRSRVLTVLPPEPAAPSLQPRLAYSRDGTCRFIWAPATMGPPESRVPITYTARCMPCSSLKTKKFHQARLLVHPYELLHSHTVQQAEGWGTQRNSTLIPPR